MSTARSNLRFERDAPTVGFAARFRAPQAERSAGWHRWKCVKVV